MGHGPRNQAYPLICSQKGKRTFHICALMITFFAYKVFSLKVLIICVSILTQKGCRQWLTWSPCPQPLSSTIKQELNNHITIMQNTKLKILVTAGHFLHPQDRPHGPNCFGNWSLGWFLTPSPFRSLDATSPEVVEGWGRPTVPEPEPHGPHLILVFSHELLEKWEYQSTHPQTPRLQRQNFNVTTK